MENWPVSLIIPNYNGEQLLPRSLASVSEAGAAYPGQTEIIVVDDGSQDNSVDFITRNFPAVKLVRHEVNKGFAEAVHSGARAAGHPIIMLLNSDVYPDRDFLAPLVKWFNRVDTFSVSPLIVNPRGKPSRVSWSRVSLIRGEIRSRDWDLSTAMKLNEQGRPLKSLFAIGGSAAIRRDMFLQLNGFLPIYKPFYYEDRDLGTRAWQQGWKTYFEPRSRVVHDHSSTIKRFFPAKKTRIIKRRNRFFYLWLHLSKRRLLFSHIPWTLVRMVTRLLRLDSVYAPALASAIVRVGQLARLRSVSARDAAGKKSLEEVLADISR